MTVRQTSKAAYESCPTINQQHDVLQALRVLGESCIADIAETLGWQRSTVSGRMNELKGVGKIVFVGKRKSHTTNILSEFWRSTEYQPSLF